MDDTPLQRRQTGGAVEPLDRDRVLKSQFQIPDMPIAKRFELRDPFAEVTHRSNSFEDMTVRADRLGAIRFVSVEPDGKRTTVSKEDGVWLRPEIVPAPTAASQAIQTTQLHAPPASQKQIEAPRPAKSALAERVARLEAELNDRYVIKRAPLRIGDVTIGQTEYRHRGDTSRVAFTESTFRLSTETNSPSVARSMVDVAEARNWQAIRVSGSDDFRRMVWLEASLRNVKTVGYEPVLGDRDQLRKEQDARQRNRLEPTQAQGDKSGPPATKQSARGGSRKAVLAALDAVLVAKRVPTRQREAVMAAATENLARRIRSGETLRVKVYDPAAPSQRPTAVPPREAQRTRERAAPGR